MKRISMLVAAAVSFCCWAGARGADTPVVVGQPSIFWRNGEWQTCKDGVWTPYFQRTESSVETSSPEQEIEPQAVEPQPAEATSGGYFYLPYPLYTLPPDRSRTHRLHRRGDVWVLGHEGERGHARPQPRPRGAGNGENTGVMGPPNVAIGQRNGIGQPAIGIGKPNVAIGQTTIGIGQPNLAIGQTTIGIGRPNVQIGQTTIGIGRPNTGIGQTTIGIGQPNGIGQNPMSGANHPVAAPRHADGERKHPQNP